MQCIIKWLEIHVYFYQVCVSVYHSGRSEEQNLIGWYIFDNETWQEARSQRPLLSLCFSGRSEKQDDRPASDCLRHLRLFLWNSWTEFKESCQEAISQCPLTLPSLCFSGRPEKQDDHPASDWLKHFRLLLWNRWTEFKFVFILGRSEK